MTATLLCMSALFELHWPVVLAPALEQLPLPLGLLSLPPEAHAVPALSASAIAHAISTWMERLTTSSLAAVFRFAGLRRPPARPDQPAVGLARPFQQRYERRRLPGCGSDPQPAACRGQPQDE